MQYDWLNRVTNMVDTIGTTKYTYTQGSQLLTEDGPFASDTVTNAYSNRLRTNLSLQQPTGVWTNLLIFDAAKRLTNVISPAGISAYSYRAGLSSLQAARLSLPNTSYITNTYDSVARLTGTYLKNSGNSTLDSYAYIYNPANERTNVTRLDSSTVAYRYDLIGQLKVADSSVNTEDRGYLYDAAWNLAERTNNGVRATIAVDGRNELSTDSANIHYYYDANGNLSWQILGTDPWWWSTAAIYSGYEYDDENRLVTWTYYNFTNTSYPQLQTKFYYDGVGRLRKRVEYQALIEGGEYLGLQQIGEVRYVYDGWRVIQERDVNNAPTVSYTRGNDLSGSLESAGGIGGLRARSSGYSGGNWTTHNYYFADGNGNVTYMLNGSQSMVASYRYDPFGNTISSSGTLASGNVYRFSSKEVHVNSGMYYYGHRFYDPILQRWINRDPLLDRGIRLLDPTTVPFRQTRLEMNLYTFVWNRAVGSSDALGLRDDVGSDNVEGIGLFSECLAIAKKRLNEYRDLIKKGQYHTGTDRWFHCVVSCEMTRKCGAVDAKLIGDFHERWNRGGDDDTFFDQRANQKGRDCGDCKNNKSCVQCCEEAGYSR